MKISFVKYQGAGNDFIMIDGRADDLFELEESLIRKFCDRKYGIGADGLIIIKNMYSQDFRMLYFNADGKEGSLCGNGARCAVIFAAECGVLFNTHSFVAYDGVHHFTITDHNRVRISMKEVRHIAQRDNALLLDTGSPHLVFNVDDDIENLNVYETGKKTRYNQEFATNGVNVNYMQIRSDGIRLRTYERGVEQETEACGTGCVAAAIARSEWSNSQELNQHYKVITNGGLLEVSFRKEAGGYSGIYLEGPVVRVFEGSIHI
ncbi:MAG: diaminopimelate epimerase [Bacteroidota bacterium]